jgi:hypothetical protein
MQIPFVGSTYCGRSKSIDSSRSINFFVELSSNPESSIPTSLIGTAGTKLWRRLGTDPIRGLYRFGDYLFVITGTNFYRIDNSGTQTLVGQLATNDGPLTFTDNGISSQGVGGNQLIITDGTYGYLYDLLDNNITIHPSENFPSPAMTVTYMDGYIIASGGNMGITVSQLYNGGIFNGLAIAAAIATPDNISRVTNIHQQLFIIKEYSTEVWYNTGIATQDGCPFARVSGAVLDYGTLATHSVSRGNNSIFFLAQQRTGDGSGSFVGVVELSGYTPTVVSPLSITYKMSKLVNRNDAIAFCYSDEGHNFYQITFPSDNATFVYDATSKMWHERSTVTKKKDVIFDEFGMPTPKADYPVSVNRHLANCYSFYDGKHLVGDYRTGNIYFYITLSYFRRNGSRG